MGEMVGISEPNTALVGGFIIGTILFLAIAAPSFLLPNHSLTMIFCFLAVCLNAAFGFWPPWAMLLISLLIAGTMARQISKWFR